MRQKRRIRENQAALVAALGLGTFTATAAQAQEAAAEATAKGAAEATAVEEAQKPKWESSAGLSFAYSSGNTDNVLFTANLGTERIAEWDELRFGASAGYGESRPRDDGNPSTIENREQNTGFVRGFGQYNRLFNERLYGLARAEAIHDSIADIRYRIPVSAGLGYYFLKDAKFKLSADIGPGYVWEKVGERRDGYASLRAGEKFEWKISETARLWQSLEYTPQITDFGNNVIQVELGVESKLYGNLSIRVVGQDTYRSEPAEIGSTGFFRKHNDFRLLAGLQYTF